MDRRPGREIFVYAGDRVLVGEVGDRDQLDPLMVAMGEALRFGKMHKDTMQWAPASSRAPTTAVPNAPVPPVMTTCRSLKSMLTPPLRSTCGSSP